MKSLIIPVQVFPESRSRPKPSGDERHSTYGGGSDARDTTPNRQNHWDRILVLGIDNAAISSLPSIHSVETDNPDVGAGGPSSESSEQR